MSGLLIRKLPDELHRKLRTRAKQNRRSVAEEVIVLLEKALAAIEPEKVVLPQPFKGQFLLTDEWIGQAKTEGRVDYRCSIRYS